MGSDLFAGFVDDIERLRRTNAAEIDLVRQVSSRLQALVSGPDWLWTDARQPSDDGYAQHLLHAADDGAFSVCSLVWKRGQKTAIHDHRAWCVVGVLEGVERETCYRLADDGGRPFLMECGVRDVAAGNVTGGIADGSDIHAVANAGDGLAVSIHVYGADLRACLSSIRTRFDDVPIRSAATTSR